METSLIPPLNTPHVSIAECRGPRHILPDLARTLTAKPVRIVRILNPFRRNFRDTFISPFDRETVGSIVARCELRGDDGEPLDVEQYKVSVNGEPVPDVEVWAELIYPGEEILLFPRAAGGGGHGFMSTLIALAGAAAGMLALGLTFFFFPALLGVIAPAMVGMLFATAASVGAGLLSWALSPGQPSAASYSSTYNPAGPQGLAAPGTPVPKGYGLMGWNGNIISSYVQFAGPNAYINVLVCYGWGPAVSIGSPTINLKPISDFFNASVQTRLGTNNQTAIDGFDRTVNGYPQEIDLLVSEGAVIVPGTGTNTQGLEVTVKFPGGLYRVTNDGNYVPLKFIYKIEVAPHGSSAWQSPLFPNMVSAVTIATILHDGYEVWPLWNVVPTDRFANSGLVYAYDNGPHTAGDSWSSTETVTIVNLDSSTESSSGTFQGVWQPVDPNLNPVIVKQWFQGYCVVEADTLSALYDTQLIYGLAAGQWDTRVTKIGYCPDNNTNVVYADSTDAKHVCDGWLWNINEVFWSNLTYPNMILLGLKALATSQLSGADIQIMAEITHDLGVDTTLPAALAGFEHDNPALVAYDVLQNPTYGMGVLPQNIDVPAFVAWANFNDELVSNQDGSTARRHVFAGVFDQAGDAWKVLQTIGTMSRATIVPIGMFYTVAIDAPGDPVQLFTVGNTKKDSFQELWLALDDRCTLIEVDFSDAQRNYRMDLPVSVMTAADINSGLQPKPTRTKLLGCTSRDQAWRFAYYQLLSTKLTLRTIQFSAAIEAVCCRYGSIIGVQSDVVQWGVGGRVQPGSTLGVLNVERTDLAFASASGWTVSVQHPLIDRGTATVRSIVGLVVTMTAALPAGRIVKAVGPDGTEYAVSGYSGSAVTLEAIRGPLAVGQAVSLYDTDVIDVIDVTGVTVTEFGSQISVVSNFSAVPTPDLPWAYGQSAGAQPAKLFRVVSIKKSGDFSFDIGALEYNLEAYSDVTPNYGEIVGTPNSSPAITNLSLTEQFQSGTLTGSSNSSVIAVGWQNGNTAVGAQVQVLASTPNVGPPPSAAWKTLGNIQGTGCTFVGTVGTTYQVQVTGFDWQGNLLGTPVSASITVVAASAAPANVTGFAGTPNTSAGTTSLVWNPATSAASYEIRYADNPLLTAWDTAAVLWEGTGTSYTDAAVRTGVYLIKAISSLATGAVESVLPMTWQMADGSGSTGGGTTGSGGGGSVSVSPNYASLEPGNSQLFTATVTGSTTHTVTWYVNGVLGGSYDSGTITADGTFTAHAPGDYTITAQSTALPGTYGSAAVNVQA
jgi:hypothetical protein